MLCTSMPYSFSLLYGVPSLVYERVRSVLLALWHHLPSRPLTLLNININIYSSELRSPGLEITGKQERNVTNHFL